MRNNIIRNMFLSFFTMGIFACSNELPALQDNNGESGDTHKVVLSINGISGKTAQTRALTEEETAALKAKEDAIDPDRIYAVVFDSEGAHGKTYKLTKGADDRYDFNIDTQGSYKLYMVANTNTVNQENAEYANADALYAVKELNRSADETTQFVMTSDVVNVTVDGTAAITNQDVTLKRAVARIDVESFDGFTIQSIDIENRYLGTKIARSGDDYDMSGLTMDNDEVENTDPTYHKKTYSFSNVLEVIGKIYTYENVSQTADEQVKLTVHGTTIDGPRDLPVTIAAVQRNHAYKVTITNTGATYDQLSYSIDVADWTAGTTLKWKDSQLTDNVTPTVSVTTASYNNVLGGTANGSLTENPEQIWLEYPSDADRQVVLTVTGGKVGSTIAPATGASAGIPTLGDGIVAADPTHTSTGKIEQTFTITVPKSMQGKDMVYDIYNMVAGNVNKKTVRIVARWDYSGIAVGDIIYADGSWSHDYTAEQVTTHIASHGVPVAIVFAASDKITTDDTGYGFTHGYAMSLTDCYRGNEYVRDNARYRWAATQADSEDPCIYQYNMIEGGNEAYSASITNENWTNFTADMNGYKRSKAIMAAGDSTAYPAVWAAHNHTRSVAPAGTSGWYLPSIGQQYAWVTAFASSVDLGSIGKENADPSRYVYWGGKCIAVREAINTYILGKNVPEANYHPIVSVNVANSGEYNPYGYYWSSTERASGYPFRLYFDTNGSLVLIGYGASTGQYRVRPVLAL